MRVVCRNCPKVYNIPDNNLPSGKKISFSCPACKGLIKLDLRSKSAQDEDAAPPPGIKRIRQKKSAPSSIYTRKQASGVTLRYGILKTMGDLPPMPQVVSKARGILSNPDSSLKELAQVVEMDPAIAAKVLRLANSAFYGLSGKVSSIQHASVLLGYKVLGELIVMSGISSFMDKSLRGYGLESGELWRHSITVAIGSRIIARKAKPELEEDVFFAGLIHDIGKLVMDRYVHERKEVFEEFIGEGENSLLHAEKKILGFDHSEMGSDFCKKWNIPDEQVQAVKFHHRPSGANGNEMAYILHIADAVALICGSETGGNGTHRHMEDGAVEFLGLMEENVNDIMNEVADSAEKIAEEFG